MKRLLFGTLLAALPVFTASPTAADVDIHVGISLPPPIVFAAPPHVVVIPETYVYVVPDVEVDIFFYDGWWWRPWRGGWYRSRHYDSGWVCYRSVPAFHAWIPPGWRKNYRNHVWKGHPWSYTPITERQLRQNWKGWQETKHWEKQSTWGVQGLKPGKQPTKVCNAAKPQPKAKPSKGR